MEKWERLRKLYKWKVNLIKNNPDASSMDKTEMVGFEHVLTEMERIDNDFDENMKHAQAVVNASEDVIEKYLDENMPMRPVKGFRKHAEEIHIRILQVEDDLKFKEF